MFERNDDVLYICYDNGGYMNTGVQRSSATPPAARTATTMPVGPEPGNAFGQGKFVPAIAMAHEIPYVATATVADLRDLEYKVTKAMGIRGARYIHILVPCPLGWGAASRRHHQAGAAGQGNRHLPGFRSRKRGEVTTFPENPPAAARRGVSQACRSATRTCSARSRQWKRSPACRRRQTRTFARYGLLDEEAN
jgi:pyruvate ferredoxin oxidoreductase beta subunit